MATRLFCDSNCELWYDIIEKYGMSVISMPYTIDDIEYFYDCGRNTDFKAFYAKIRKGSIPVTSALNEYNYTEYFEPVLKAGDDIIYLSFSHELSGTFNSMRMAIETLSEKYPGRTIRCLNTKSISLGAGVTVLESAKLYESMALAEKPFGAEHEEFLRRAEEISKRARALFTVDDLHHLKRGGRISGGAAFFGSLLGIKPLLRITEEGKIENYAKAKGRKKSIEMLLDGAEAENIDLSRPVYFLDADADDAALLKEKFKERFGENANGFIQAVGPVIGTHCGPGTLGICFLTK